MWLRGCDLDALDLAGEGLRRVPLSILSEGFPVMPPVSG